MGLFVIHANLLKGKMMDSVEMAFETSFKGLQEVEGKLGLPAFRKSIDWLDHLIEVAETPEWEKVLTVVSILANFGAGCYCMEAAKREKAGE
jgi:hypothetical protein